MPDEPTLGEALRRIDKLEERADNRLVSLSTYQAERRHDQDEVADLEKRLDKFENRIDWARRAGVTGVLMPVVAGILLFLLLRGQ